MARFRDKETPEERYRREQAPAQAVAAREQAAKHHRKGELEAQQTTIARYTSRQAAAAGLARIEPAPDAEMRTRAARKHFREAERLRAEATRLEAAAKPKKRGWF